jgi:hypothetical protein
MLVAGIINIILGLALSISSSLSQDVRLMLSSWFNWLPIAHGYSNASKAIAKLEVMKPVEKDYPIGAIVPTEQFGEVVAGTPEFRDLVAMMRKGGIISQPEMGVNRIVLAKWTGTIGNIQANRQSEVTYLTLKLLQDDAVLKEMGVESTQFLKDEIVKATQHRFAMFTLILSGVLFVIGIALLIINLTQGHKNGTR